MVQEAGRGDRADDVAVMPGEHPGQKVSCDQDMRHDVDIPDVLPLIIRGFGASCHRDSCVGTENIDPPMSRFDLRDETLDIRLARHVALNRGRSDLSGDVIESWTIDVSDDHRLWLLRCEPDRKRATDATRGAGHDDDPILQLHRHLLSPHT